MKEINWGGFELITAVLGFVGAALGISYSPQMSKREMFAALLAGVMCAVLGPSLVMQLYTLPPIVNNALAFIFGIGGMFIVPGLLAIWRGFAADRYGRIRGVAALNTSARYWRIRFASGTPADGAAFWRIGALYLFGGVVDIVAPEYGFKVTTNNADVRERLNNGREAVAILGNRFDRVSGKFMVNTTSMLIGTLLADLRSAPVWLDLEVATRAWWTWPLFNDATDDTESMDQTSPDYTEISLAAREVV